MSESEKAQIQTYVSRWQNVTSLLAKVRDNDIRNSDTAVTMKNFTGSAIWAITHRPSSATSGLIEQQRWFIQILHNV